MIYLISLTASAGPFFNARRFVQLSSGAGNCRLLGTTGHASASERNISLAIELGADIFKFKAKQRAYSWALL